MTTKRWTGRMRRFGIPGMLAAMLLVAAAPVRATGVQIGVRVVSATTGDPIVGAAVLLDVEGAVWTGGTGADGRVSFPAKLPRAGAVAAAAALRLEVRAPGFATLARECFGGERTGELVAQLWPEDAALTTGLVLAAKGGSFVLPGLGRLEVAPGALAADAHLRVLAPPPSSSCASVFEGEVLRDLRLDAVDAGGHPMSGVIPTGPTGVRLFVAPWYRPSRVEGATNLALEALALDADLAVVRTRPVTWARPGLLEVELGDGRNVVRLDYGVPDAGCREWSPWSLELLPIAGSGDGRVVVPISCGYLGSTGSLAVAQGQEQASVLGISAEASASVGWEAGTVFARVSAQVGVTVRGDFRHQTATTEMVESRIGTPTVGTANGAPPSALLPPWACTDGDFVLGIVSETYACYARRICRDPGSKLVEFKPLGNLKVAQRLSFWYANLTWNPTCPGCSPTGMTPATHDPNWSGAPDLSKLLR
ncbi:MAG: hypothetical protein R3F20_14955 [Planctomycetota bacterium]